MPSQYLVPESNINFRANDIVNSEKGVAFHKANFQKSLHVLEIESCGFVH